MLGIQVGARQGLVRLLVAIVVGLGLGALALATPAAAATITVTTTSDAYGNDGHVTLREAIESVNNGVDVNDVVATGTYGTNDTIQFTIGTGVQTISPTGGLPFIIKPVTIDGTTQPVYAGAPLIVLDGSTTGTGYNGLVINASDVTVKGLVIRGFDQAGIVINQPDGKVLGSYIGIAADGTTAAGNGTDGIQVEGSGAIIGGAIANDRNVISGNGANGIFICTCASATVKGNYIGTNAAGTAPLGNAQYGAFIYDAVGVTIGGTTAGAGNVISGNNVAGVAALSTGHANLNLTITGNYIGTDVNGTAALANGSGVLVNDAGGITVGGTNPGAGNLISGNTTFGVYFSSSTPGVTTDSVIAGNLIGTDKNGTAALSLVNNQTAGGVMLQDSERVTVGGTSASARNIISGNSGTGVNVFGSGTTGAKVFGNYVGPDKNGTATIVDGGGDPAQSMGIEVRGAPNVLIGGTDTGAGNVVSGHKFEGILITGTVTGTIVAGNLIGPDKNGTAPLGNLAGVHVLDASGATIGGTSVAARNIISGNNVPMGVSGSGIIVNGSSTFGTVIAGNYIGTTPNGTAALPNAIGIGISEGTGTTVGGTATGAGNVISGNTNDGVSVSGAVTAATTIFGNYIGTNAAGTAAVGNGGNGVGVQTSLSVKIGGSTAGARNVISGNGASGVLMSGPGTIRGNYIGSDKNGTAALGNSAAGIEVALATNVTIGGTNAADANLITGNSGAGVSVVSVSQAAILGNSIYGNTGLGIDLANNGVTPNDAGDSDGPGPNGLQNFPIVTSAATTVEASHIAVTLSSQASQTYTVEVFSSPSCDGSGNGEGQTFLTRGTLMTDGSMTGSLALSASGMTIGQMVTATATDAGNNTSEFSACVPVVAPAMTVTPSGGTTATVEGGATDTFTIVLTSQPTAPVMIAMASSATGLASFAPSATLTFTAANWNIPQPVTVTSVEDQVYNVANYNIAFTVTSSDTFYNGMTVAALPAMHTENDPQSTLTVANVSSSEAASGTSTLTFTVTMVPASGSSVTVQYATSNGTATGGVDCAAGIDYLIKSGTLTFAPLETSKTVPVTVCSDAVSESPETLTLTLSNPTIATIGQATATGTIQDGTTLTISIADATVVEGNSGTTAATFPVTLSIPSAQTVTVQYATGDGTAQGGVDFQNASGTVTFQPGETSKSIAVNVIGDTLFEPNETFKLTLASPTGGASLGRAQATGTIQNDDVPRPCTPRPPIVVQPTASGGQLQVTVTASPLNTQAANPMTTIRFWTFQNARVTLNGQTIASGQAVPIPANTTSLSFTVARATPGQATNVPFTVVDTCGEWPTFVGGGTSGF